MNKEWCGHQITVIVDISGCTSISIVDHDELVLIQLHPFTDFPNNNRRVTYWFWIHVTS